jgi:RNA-directed DNA polymerase
MQKKLSQKATKESEHHFENLYGLLCNEVWLRVAAHKTLQNKGSGTAGIDGKTKSNFLGDFDGHITSLKELLATKTFEPQPVKRVYIPKPSSEKKRPLPEFEDHSTHSVEPHRKSKRYTGVVRRVYLSRF